ncbi:MAG: double-strand break repair helicase AddA [Parvibaculum sp.]
MSSNPQTPADQADRGETNRRQAEAADPTASVWVSANAGSGKTHVLINRVIRLLLAGTPPERILCLTFTKAAAAEMSSRLYRTLGEWAVMNDKALAGRVEALEHKQPDRALLLSARLLFARAIETPGGLKIQTIHAFCERLLGRFPLEAGVPPHFEILDEGTALENLALARDDLLDEIVERRDIGDDPLVRAFNTVEDIVGEYGFDDLFKEIIGKRAALADLLQAHEGVLESVLRTALGLGPDEDDDSILQELCEQGLPLKPLRDALPHLLAGKATDLKTAEVLEPFLASTTRHELADTYVNLFYRQDGGLKKVSGYVVTGAAVKPAPFILTLFEEEQLRVAALRERRQSLRIAEATLALLTLADELIKRFDAHKTRHALLDYEDLILKSRDLLKRSGAAAWVLYKLDGGLDHILVDEAQDTSPHQWEVVQALAEEFLSGVGVRDFTRTIFAVGDEKQSIYSFQGADPTRFAAMRAFFGGRVKEAGKKWNPVELLLSFRSTPEVLQAVDDVFADPAAADGLNMDGEPPTHYARREMDAGLVEIWPLCEPVEDEESLPWDAPLDYPKSESPDAQLALQVATTIAHWLATKEELKGRGRPIRPGDVLILVRRRNRFVEEVIRALKNEGVPVAGTDRMVLTDQIAVMDLMAAASFALFPEDDLTLASLLKSPLIGITEDELFELAYGREGSLWDAVGHAARIEATRTKGGTFAKAYHQLTEILSRADRLRPYEFFAELLVKEGGREKLRSRLGADVDDPVDEFLARALNYETIHTPALQGFLHWIGAGEAQVKREMSEGRNEVRVMTVHGSKGLEAEIVFLPDTCTIPDGKYDPRLLPVETESGKLHLFPGRKANDDALTGAAREKLGDERMREYRRLLYVAMTRAKDRLYIAGYRGKNEPKETCWYNLVTKALVPKAETVTLPDGRSVWRIEGEQKGKPEPDKNMSDLLPELDLPGWATGLPAPEPTPPKPLSPSKLVEDEAEPAMLSPLQAGARNRFKRGRLIHRLLQTLPDIAGERREHVARRFLSQPGWRLDEEAQEEIWQATLSVLSEPAFGLLFGPGSRAEVPLVGEVIRDGKPLYLSGQIDRLLVTDDEILIVDFKTNRPPPARVENVSAAYLGQMAAYQALLGVLYPERSIRAALLWTDGPRLMEIPAEMLAKFM